MRRLSKLDSLVCRVEETIYPRLNVNCFIGLVLPDEWRDLSEVNSTQTGWIQFPRGECGVELDLSRSSKLTH
jgi:hypothetical protein